MQGIYKIINWKNGKYYVGSSTNVKRRWSEHIRQLNKNCHDNKKLQNAWNSHGVDSFYFITIELCFDVNQIELFNIEQRFLDIAKTDPTNVYNHSFTSNDGFDWNSFDYGKFLKRGRDHKDFDDSVYNFINKFTNEQFTGTRHDLYTKFNFKNMKNHLRLVVNGKRNHIKGWMLKDEHEKQLNKPKTQKKIETYPIGEFKFIHKSGEIFSGNCFDFSLKHGIKKYRIEQIFNLGIRRDGWKLAI